RCPVYLIDPDAVSSGNLPGVTHIQKGASAGMRELLTLIKP
ncbi:MAG: NAD-dependent protein deacylase, partial [Prevotellaceae bacterium]|nr:NAD-dependent protein deacylase [Prevotellaceae bacterium]